MPKEPPRPHLTMMRCNQFKDMLYMLAEAGVDEKEVLHEVRRAYHLAALRLERGNACRAAARIHVHRNTIARWKEKEREG